jgi:plastocyanin
MSEFHNVASTGNPSFTGSGNPVNSPQSYSQTFTTPGTYVFYCVVHGTPSSGMRGTITVQ